MIVPFEDLPQLREEIEEPIALRMGCYDLLHEGHVASLERAKRTVGEEGGKLFVGLWSDERARERKGPTRPIRDIAARLALIDAMRLVDYSFIMPDKAENGDLPSLIVAQSLRPDVFVVASSHQNDERIRMLGSRVVYDTTPPLNSTSKIIETILDVHGAVAPK